MHIDFNAIKFHFLIMKSYWASEKVGKMSFLPSRSHAEPQGDRNSAVFNTELPKLHWA